MSKKTMTVQYCEGETFNEDGAFSLDVAYMFDFDWEYVAETCAEDFRSNHDGWDCTWPLTFVIKIGDEIRAFSVELEFDPVYFAVELPPSAQAAEGGEG